MNTLFHFTIVLAVVSCINGKPADKTGECLIKSKMTAAEAMEVGTPAFKPTPSFFCYIGCMAEGEDFGATGSSLEGSMEEELKECLQNIVKTGDECEVGEQLYQCAEEAGVFPTNADT